MTTDIKYKLMSLPVIAPWILMNLAFLNTSCSARCISI